MSKIASILASIALTLSPQVDKSFDVAKEKTYINEQTLVKTETRFSQKEIAESDPIGYETSYRDDENLEFGETKILNKGENGEEVKAYRITYYDEEILDKELINTEIKEPKNEVVLKGTKISWKKEDANRCGEFKYWHKYENVYMTTYTPQCLGCNAWTSIGLKAGYGIVAVDPKKIPYWTKVCIPGYGIAVAGNTGGAMRSYPGLLIDLGFPSLAPQDKWLTTGRYDMYILNNEDKRDRFFVGDLR